MKLNKIILSFISALAILLSSSVTSFAKVTFGGGGLSFMAASGKNLSLIKKMRESMVICPDKINQKRLKRKCGEQKR